MNNHLRILFVACFAALAISLPPLAAPSQAQAKELFFADINTVDNPQFSREVYFKLDKTRVLGLFNNKNRKRPGRTTLTLKNAPVGAALELTFDLYLVGNWESRGQRLADRFTVDVNGDEIYLLRDFPCRIQNNDEVLAVDALGLVDVGDHTLGYWMVPVAISIPGSHIEASEVEIEFSARLTGKGTEFWGLKNIRVTAAE